MNRVQVFAAHVGVLFALVSGSLAAQEYYLKKAPAEGDIPHGKIVYVDDGRCPKGEIKEITGGSREKSIPRKTRCIKRPDEPRK